MTPQSNFTVIAPIIPERMAALKALLAGMNLQAGNPKAPPGMADPCNDIIPFGTFKKLHYARFVILDDPTLVDFARIGEPVPEYPVALAFMGDCDGCADTFLADMAQRASKGLRDVFSNCECFHSHTDLLTWMREHSAPSAAAYVNHIGRTVVQIRKDDALRRELVAFLKQSPPPDNQSLQVTRKKLVDHARTKCMIPKSYEPTPIACKLRRFLHAMCVPAAIGLVVALVVVFLASVAAALSVVVRIVLAMWLPLPVALLALVFLTAILVFLVVLRAYEKAEPEIVSRPTRHHAEDLAKQEDHDVVNQFSVIGAVKPGKFRRMMLIINLWVIDWFARHIYSRGYLARIRTIHFARWVFINDKKRVVFASSYDGSLESYNDDFINKGGFGLNFAFGGALGYPRTRWIVFDGAKEEQKFKYTLRRHQIPTQVWYNAYPGLTVYDLARNARVREGLERARMSNAKIRTWLTDL
jgi:hypothetical protein